MAQEDIKCNIFQFAQFIDNANLLNLKDKIPDTAAISLLIQNIRRVILWLKFIDIIWKDYQHQRKRNMLKYKEHIKQKNSILGKSVFWQTL